MVSSVLGGGVMKTGLGLEGALHESVIDDCAY